MDNDNSQYILSVCYMPDTHCMYLFNARNFSNCDNYYGILQMRRLKYKELSNLYKVPVLIAVKIELRFELINLIQCSMLCCHQH